MRVAVSTGLGVAMLIAIWALSATVIATVIFVKLMAGGRI